MKRFLTLLFFFTALSALASAGNLKISMIDVGQGDSIFIVTPGGKTILIDAGEREAAKKVIGFLKAKNVQKIDTLIATHPHEDHIGSMDNVIMTFQVGKIYMPKVVDNTETFAALLSAIKTKKLKISIAAAGVRLDSDPDMEAVFLGPVGGQHNNFNNDSAVLKIRYGSTSFLFTGDAEAESEKEILSAGADVKADVIKIGHHGSKTSTSAAFLSAVSPQTALISVGYHNKFKHPSKEIIKRLEKAGVQIYRTDQSGTIDVESDGNKITFQTEKK